MRLAVSLSSVCFYSELLLHYESHQHHIRYLWFSVVKEIGIRIGKNLAIPRSI